MKIIEEVKDQIELSIFGITKQTTHKLGICIQCRRPWQEGTHTSAGEREYKISGICEECFDGLVEGE